jgi:hypothetical protein
MPRLLLTAAALVLLVGCGPGSTASVSGTVTLNGQPLARGFVSFTPEDGQGGTAGGDVEAGRYRVAGLKPGKYRVQVVGRPEGPIIQPGSKEAVRTLSEREIQAMMNPLPPDATGNDRTVEVRAGEQTHDIKLQARSRP